MIVCPGCQHAQEEGPHFCAACGAPLSALATVGPFERIFAQGHAYRRAAAGPTSRIVVAGMWLLLLPQFAILLIAPPPAALALLLLFGATHGVLLYRVTRNYLRRTRPPAPGQEPPDPQHGDHT